MVFEVAATRSQCNLLSSDLLCLAIVRANGQDDSVAIGHAAVDIAIRLFGVKDERCWAR